jgi:hypothetical protein
MDAVDSLLKPVHPDRLAAAVESDGALVGRQLMRAPQLNEQHREWLEISRLAERADGHRLQVRRA